jgi:GNAT superfamily N-acetyltransferase
VTAIRPLTDADLLLVDARLPLHRLDQPGDGFYLVAWEDDEPVGHGYVALADPPELGDVFVLPRHRRRGIATALTAAAEREVAARGYDRLRLSYGVANDAARSVYEQAGYVDAGLPRKRVTGAITIRGEPVEVDDTLVYLEKRLR